MTQDGKIESQKTQTLKSIAIYALLLITLSIATLIKYIVFAPASSVNSILSYTWTVIALFLLIFVYALYGFLTRKELIERHNELGVICTCVAISYIACIFIGKIGTYAMPIFLCAFLLAPLSKRKDAFTANLFCVAMIVCALTAETAAAGTASGIKIGSMFILGIFGGTLTVFCLSYERKRLDFILKGAAVCLAVVIMAIAFDIMYYAFTPAASPIALPTVKQYIGDKTILFAASAIFAQLILSIILQPLFEKIFNLLTNARLTELTDHNSPLIKRLITEAPGTFNHSLAVANFAEVCATAIGENPYLAKACAYYHDIGKLNNPLFFKENQSDQNPHDEILPEVSAEIIKNHTKDGYALCKQYRIPTKVAKVTVEHHGNMPISIFYNKAKELTDTEVDIKKYSYEGNEPTTKIAAIIMICDSAEAAIRSMDSPDADKAEAVVSSLIWARIKAGQFDECGITLKQLNTVKDTIVRAFGGVFHKRIKYPEEK